MDSISRSLLQVSILPVAIASACVAAAELPSPVGHVVQGLGESIPVGAKNVSLSPHFKVYTFTQDGVKYVQINSLQDEVLTVLVVTPGAQQQLPIGSAAGTPVVFVDPAKQP
ncbi:hypothetical protein NB699_001583 [Xanthomonas sacchari]|uniref:Uncharacterized protein n=1 Tax=Xanthomonas sacchari TaxID=56458 RepID=A0AA46SNN8_9XANT|nr:hypothetical protein [Xanthomonas sacchari]MCW0366600.1 hypothetical protein [Xanthomonas sacchari]MCW0440375.1 hypothetical protein [Xanthomonas sacchari]UYK87064.1 hypothetical protein NG824_11060 [Xanthomonas sacchari]